MPEIQKAQIPSAKEPSLDWKLESAVFFYVYAHSLDESQMNLLMYKYPTVSPSWRKVYDIVVLRVQNFADI